MTVSRQPKLGGPSGRSVNSAPTDKPRPSPRGVLDDPIPDESIPELRTRLECFERAVKECYERGQVPQPDLLGALRICQEQCHAHRDWAERNLKTGGDIDA